MLSHEGWDALTMSRMQAKPKEKKPRMAGLLVLHTSSGRQSV
jgi:hypothetical protein